MYRIGGSVRQKVGEVRVRGSVEDDVGPGERYA